MQTDSMTVEGYSNYATFGVAVTLNNDRTMHRHIHDTMREIVAAAPKHENVPGIWTEAQAARFELADFLKDYTERLCEQGHPSPMASQMVQAGLAEVNWAELADDMLNGS